MAQDDNDKGTTTMPAAPPLFQRDVGGSFLLEGGISTTSHHQPPTASSAATTFLDDAARSFHAQPNSMPLPFPKGCGQIQLDSERCESERAGPFSLSLADGYGREEHKGNPGSGKPVQCVTKVNHDEGRGSFCFSLSPRPPRLLTPKPRLT